MNREMSRRSFLKAGSIVTAATAAGVLAGGAADAFAAASSASASGSTSASASASSAASAASTSASNGGVTFVSSEPASQSASSSASSSASGERSGWISATSDYDMALATEIKTCDILICGAGAAGLMAGVEASRAGAEVMVIEKGESVAVSNGAVAGGPLAVGSKIQNALNDGAGDGFTVDIAFDHMMEYAHWSINAPVVRAALEISGETVDMFQDDFGLEMAVLPDSYNAGYQVRCCFSKDGVAYAGATGEDRMGPLADEIKRNGGSILFSTTLVSLVLDQSSSVVGVLATDADGNLIEIDATATLVATGGFEGSDALMYEHFGTQTLPLGNTLSTGDGMSVMRDGFAVLDTHWGILGNEFGGSNSKDPWSFANMNSAYTLAISGGLLVNRFGRRFTNEGKYAQAPLAIGGAISLAVGGPFYGIFDQTAIDQFATTDAGKNITTDIQTAVANGWGFQADTLEELATITALTDLADTVTTYNTYCTAAADAEYHKDAAYLAAIMTGPFYAFEYQPSCWATIGGVKTNDRLQVLDQNGLIISGLYCAGVDNGSLLASPYSDYEGTSLMMAFNSGRLAGKYMAADITAATA